MGGEAPRISKIQSTTWEGVPEARKSVEHEHINMYNSTCTFTLTFAMVSHACANMLSVHCYERSSFGSFEDLLMSRWWTCMHDGRQCEECLTICQLARFLAGKGCIFYVEIPPFTTYSKDLLSNPVRSHMEFLQKLHDPFETQIACNLWWNSIWLVTGLKSKCISN